MADLTITSSAVIAGSGAQIEMGTAGETVTAGQSVYRAASGNLMLTDNDSATPAAREARGIALNGAANGQPLAIARGGDVSFGAILTAGTTYAVSNTAGAICPDADVGTGEYICILGVARSTSVLALNIQAPNVSR